MAVTQRSGTESREETALHIKVGRKTGNTSALSTRFAVHNTSQEVPARPRQQRRMTSHPTLRVLALLASVAFARSSMAPRIFQQLILHFPHHNRFTTAFACAVQCVYQHKGHWHRDSFHVCYHRYVHCTKYQPRIHPVYTAEQCCSDCYRLYPSTSCWNHYSTGCTCLSSCDSVVYDALMTSSRMCALLC